MGMGKTGGILMLVSLFLPMWLITITGKIMGQRVAATLLWWLFGLYFIMVMGTMFVGFAIEIFSILLFVLILIFSIICIAKEGKAQMVLGILALLLMIAYIAYMYIGAGIGPVTTMGDFTVTLIPIGGLLCIVGAILATVGGAQD